MKVKRNIRSERSVEVHRQFFLVCGRGLHFLLLVHGQLRHDHLVVQHVAHDAVGDVHDVVQPRRRHHLQLAHRHAHLDVGYVLLALRAKVQQVPQVLRLVVVDRQQHRDRRLGQRAEGQRRTEVGVDGAVRARVVNEQMRQRHARRDAAVLQVHEALHLAQV